MDKDCPRDCIRNSYDITQTFEDIGPHQDHSKSTIELKITIKAEEFQRINSGKVSFFSHLMFHSQYIQSKTKM